MGWQGFAALSGWRFEFVRYLIRRRPRGGLKLLSLKSGISREGSRLNPDDKLFELCCKGWAWTVSEKQKEKVESAESTWNRSS